MKGIIQPLAASGIAIPLALIACLAGAFQSAAPPAWRAAQTVDQAAASPPPVPLALDARAIFEDKCATCHGSDGRAKTFKAKFNKARDLTGAAWQAEASDERIYNSIANGRGRKMPAFAKKLSRAEIEGLVALVRSLKK
jgi:mono/diheme cytochrome c family protein